MFSQRSLVFLISFLVLGQASCTNGYKDQRSRSPHFKEGRFSNPKTNAKSFWSFLRMRWNTEYAEWPEKVESQPQKVLQERVNGDEIHVTHINHSTLLIQSQGLNILTDPIYSERCSPVSWAGPKRVIAPGVLFENIPPIDVILISHDHYDHLDLPTMERLIQRDHPLILLGLGVGERLKQRDQVTELDWWESKIISEKLTVHFVPVQHFSGRSLFDRNSTLWGGFVLDFNSHKVYFGGDTGYANHFKETKQRLGSMDLALLPIGAYAPRDFMGYAHINPEEAVLAHKDLGAKKSIGIHYGTFQLTAEPYDQPQKDLTAAMTKHSLPSDVFLTPKFGQTLIFSNF